MKRREKILEILKEKQEITVKELSNIFNVSEMTIYREIKELEKEGHIKRKHGSILLNTEKNKETISVSNCPICSKPITRAHPYKITVEDTEIETCCEHCGLMMHKKLEDKKVSALTYDFITENPVSALNAYYVVGSEAIPCCSPSVIPFASKSDAEKFAKGFGGKVMTFIEAYNEIVNNMHIDMKSCCLPAERITFTISDIQNKE